MHIFRDKRWDFGRGVANDIEERDDIWSPCKVLKDLDFTLDFLLLHRLKNLDDTLLLVDDVDPLEDLAFRAVLARRSLNT